MRVYEIYKVISLRRVLIQTCALSHQGEDDDVISKLCDDEVNESLEALVIYNSLHSRAITTVYNIR